MKVYDTDKPFVYEVDSSKPGKRYKVHLLFNHGAGMCDCPAHAYRCQGAIYRGEPAYTKATICKHVEAAALHLVRSIMEHQVKNQ
jgi:hypothetical protein